MVSMRISPSFEDLLQLRQTMLSSDGKEKAFATEANAFPIRLGVLAHKAALHRSFTVCSRPLAAQAYSLQAGRSLFGFARPAL